MKLLISLLIGCGVVLSQGTQTIFVNVFTLHNSTPATSAVVRNIGAQYQQITAFITDDGSGLCATGSGTTGWDIHVEGSTNNSTWFIVGQRILAIPDPGTGSTVVSAAYAGAYIRVNYAKNGGTHCLLTVQYAGTFTGVPTSSAPVTAFGDNLTHFFGSAAAAKTTVVTCVVGQPVVYAASFANDNAAANTVLVEASSDAIGTLVNVYATPLIPPNDTRIWPQGPRAYWFVNSSPQSGVPGTFPYLLIQPSVANINYDMVIRCE